MRLEALRELGWSNRIESALVGAEKAVFGDQDVINRVLGSFLHLVRYLPCDFNWRPDYCLYEVNDCTRCSSPPTVLHGSRAAFVGSEERVFIPVKPFQLAFNAFELVLTSRAATEGALEVSENKASLLLEAQWFEWLKTTNAKGPCSGHAGSQIVDSVSALLLDPPAAALPAIMQAAGSDKAAHGFAAVYEEELAPLRLKPGAVMVEVGVFRGASLRVWATWLEGPERRVLGLDAFEGRRGRMGRRNSEGEPLTYDDPRGVLRDQQYGRLPRGVEALIVDQGSRADLGRFMAWAREGRGGGGGGLMSPTDGGGLVDVVLDDGSHLMRDQQQTLGALFPLVRPGGLYVMEDVHTSKQQGYDVHAGPSGKSNSWWVLVETLTVTGRVESEYLEEAQARYLERWLKAMRCYIILEAESEVCVLEKREAPAADTTENNRAIAEVVIIRHAHITSTIRGEY
mmetsp:Transcript_44028/g.99480  ORF Transcript_44028/g.99480 Transcript_44028/m.99480 type:complete len:456 (+) Transcript_44028:173-1540(+)